MSESATAAKRQRRRIPDELRKRSAMSCDLCRKRRCRCVASPDGEGCLTCREQNVPCTYTTPRKTRFYGSVDDLSDRYQCLDAIVKAAFPNDPTSTTADLLQLGHRMGYPMPDLSRPNRPGVRLEDLIRVPGRSASTRSDSAASDSRDTTGHTSPASEPAVPVAGGHGANPTVPFPECSDAALPESDEPHLSLARDPSGVEHYIGPSGTLNFLSHLRHLIFSTHIAAEEACAESVCNFTRDDGAQALGTGEIDGHHDPQVDSRQGTQETQKPQGNAAGANTAPSVQPSGDYHARYGPPPSSVTSSIAREFARRPAVDLDAMLRGFPPGDMLEMLIHAYFKNVHDDFPLFHRPSFENEYELYVVQARRYLHMAPMAAPIPGSRPLPDWGWVGCLHMMMVFGSISNPRIPGIQHYQLRRQCIAATHRLFPHFVSKCTLSNVRVLLLLALFLHNNSERNAAWNLVGTATRIAFALGLHRGDTSSALPPLDREIRRCVFCTLYAFEQFLASSLGRPSGLQELDVEVIPPREGLLEGSSGIDAALPSLSLKLQAILAKTRLMYARPPKPDTGPQPGPARPTIEDILKSLAAWKQEVAHTSFNLPFVKSEVRICGTIGSTDVMDFDELKLSLSWKTRSQLRSGLLLHIQYHHIAIACTRPVLLREIAAAQKPMGRGYDGDEGEDDDEDDDKDDDDNNDAPMSPVADICLFHACQLTYLLLLLDTFDLVNGLSGLDIFYAYCAAMVLILRLLRRPLSHAETRAPQSREAEMQVLVKDLVLRLQAVIHRTEKSQSMARFANVVDAFAECTRCGTGRRRVGRSRARRRQADEQVWFGGSSGAAASPGGEAQTVTVGADGGQHGVPGFDAQQAGLAGMPLHPDQAVAVAPGLPNPAHVETPPNMWPLSGFGVMGVQLDDGGLGVPSMGSEPGAAPERGNMENIFAAYGIP